MNGLSTRDQFNASGSSLSSKGGNNGGMGGIFLGWGRNFSKHGYAGLQLEGSLIDAKRNSTMVNGSITQNLSTKTNGVWGAALLLGLRPWANKGTMIYVRLGADYARWKHSASATSGTAAQTVTGSTSSNTLAFAPGLGVRSMMYKNMFVNVEYKYSFFNTLTLNNASGSKSSSRPRLQTFTVGIGWRF